MDNKLRRALKVLCVPAAVLALIQTAPAQHSTPFAGAYQLTNVVEDGDQVHFTLKVKINNPTTADIKGGIVVLMNSQPGKVLLGKVATVQVLPRLGQATVSGQFTVWAGEYERWQQGHDPVLEFLIPGTSGAKEVLIQARRAETASQLNN